MKAYLLSTLNITKEGGTFYVTVRTKEMKTYIESISSGKPVVVTLKEPRPFLEKPEYVLQHMRKINNFVDEFISGLALKIKED